jgi:carbonic anhydrase
MKKSSFFSEWRDNLPSGLAVYLVALPLCLGIGLASTSIPGVIDTPNLFAGVISGIIGGIVVGSFSGSRLGVSGPAAGLITIVIAAIITLGSYQAFLATVVLAGIIQLLGGVFKAGAISNYFPSSVIKGMLAGIGITLILKEIPHLFGWDANPFGAEAFQQIDGQNTFSEIANFVNYISPGATVIGIVSILILLIFELKVIKKMAAIKFIPGSLIVVVIGIALNGLFLTWFPNLMVSKKHLVDIPVAQNIGEFFHFFTFPDFSILSNPNSYVIAFTIAIVASLETLLSVEATDKLDPQKQVTPTNKELKAQGVGNIISGLIGGLPITQVIVRSSANINAGATTRLSAVFHGTILLLSILFIPQLLNYIPLAALAAVLFFVGYKLSSFKLFKSMYNAGYEQFIPFIVTIAGVLFADLLKGIVLGMAVCLFFVLRKSYKNNIEKKESNAGETLETQLILSDKISFLNKGKLIKILTLLPDNTILIIDGTNCVRIDNDILDLINHFKSFTAKKKGIDLTIINLPLN